MTIEVLSLSSNSARLNTNEILWFYVIKQRKKDSMFIARVAQETKDLLKHYYSFFYRLAKEKDIDTAIYHYKKLIESLVTLCDPAFRILFFDYFSKNFDSIVSGELANLKYIDERELSPETKIYFIVNLRPVKYLDFKRKEKRTASYIYEGRMIIFSGNTEVEFNLSGVASHRLDIFAVQFPINFYFYFLSVMLLRNKRKFEFFVQKDEVRLVLGMETDPVFVVSLKKRDKELKFEMKKRFQIKKSREKASIKRNMVVFSVTLRG